jgi:hypothetical protein
VGVADAAFTTCHPRGESDRSRRFYGCAGSSNSLRISFPRVLLPSGRCNSIRAPGTEGATLGGGTIFSRPRPRTACFPPGAAAEHFVCRELVRRLFARRPAALQRGVFRWLANLQAAIMATSVSTTANPADPDRIIEVNRENQAIACDHHWH